MLKFRKNRAAEETTASKGILTVKMIMSFVGVALVLVLVIIVLAALYSRSQNEKRELEEQLQLRQDVADALEAKNHEQESLIESLQADLDDFLNIQNAQPVITGEQIEEQLSTVSELVTQRYIYTRAARETQNKTWLWDWTMPFSDTSLLVMYNGEIKAGIDFSAIKVAVNEDERVITVTVPASKILNNNIPQESIEVLEVKNNLFNEVSFEDYNEFIASQKPVAEQEAIEMGLLTEADHEAQTLVKAFLSLIPGIDTYHVDIVTQ